MIREPWPTTLIGMPRDDVEVAGQPKILGPGPGTKYEDNAVGTVWISI